MADLKFVSWDYAVMSLAMILFFTIGIYFRYTGGRQKTNEEYLLGDRNLSVFPVGISLMTSFMSAITLLGVSAENYTYGFLFVIVNFAYLIATPIASRLYLPVFYTLKKTSTYEYLELRFGPRTRLLTSLTYTFQMIFYNGIVLYAPSIVLEAVTGLNRVISILVVGLVCTFYSTIGGIKAVVWTDLFQSLSMYAAVISVVVFASIKLGGLGTVMQNVYDGGRLNMVSLSLDPTVRHTWWSLLIGGIFLYLSLYAVNHTQVQRLQTVNTLSKAQKALWLSWPALLILSVSTCLSGLAIYATYKDCDPLSSNQITANDQLLPYYVINEMKTMPGLAGLFVAGIFSASLSTISASCNSLAAVTLEDYLKQFIKPSVLMAKCFACLYGIMFVALAFLAEYLGGLLQASLTIFGAVGGPVLGVFTLGLFTTFANENGAIVSLLTGMALTLWMNFGGPRPSNIKLPVSVDGCPAEYNISLTEHTVQDDNSEYFYLYRISYMWTSALGFIIVLIVGSVVSMLWKRKHPWQQLNENNEPDLDLFTPPLANWLRKRQNDKVCLMNINLSSPPESSQNII